MRIYQILEVQVSKPTLLSPKAEIKYMHSAISHYTGSRDSEAGWNSNLSSYHTLNPRVPDRLQFLFFFASTPPQMLALQVVQMHPTHEMPAADGQEAGQVQPPPSTGVYEDELSTKEIICEEGSIHQLMELRRVQLRRTGTFSARETGSDSKAKA